MIIMIYSTEFLDDRTFCFVIQHGRHTIVCLDLQGLVANHLYMAYIGEYPPPPTPAVACNISQVEQWSGIWKNLMTCNFGMWCLYGVASSQCYTLSWPCLAIRFNKYSTNDCHVTAAGH